MYNIAPNSIHYLKIHINYVIRSLLSFQNSSLSCPSMGLIQYMSTTNLYSLIKTTLEAQFSSEHNAVIIAYEH